MPLRTLSRILSPVKGRAAWKAYWAASPSEQRKTDVKVFKFFVQCGLISHVIREHGATVTVMIGPSMFPSLADGDWVLLNHLAPVLDNIQPGDVVVSKGVVNPRHQICKRVRGLAGDVITVHFPSSVFGATGMREKTVKVPPGHIWLEGDNLIDSHDSRHYGPIPYALVMGKAWLRVWPFSKFGPVDTAMPRAF